MAGIELIGIDADNTLWHSERHFAMTSERFVALLGDHAEPDVVTNHLAQVEVANLAYYGYGVQSFVLSMIETALALTGGDIDGHVVAELLEAGKGLLRHPVELLPGARQAVEGLRGRYRLVLLTKGELFHQESKVAASGLGELFDRVVVVATKDQATYRRLLDEEDVAPDAFLMVGDSLRSEIAPVVAIGGRAVHVPHEHVASMEQLDPTELPPEGERWWRLDDLGGLPGLVARLDDGT